MTIRHTTPIHPAVKPKIPDQAIYDIPPMAVSQRETAEAYPINGGSSSTFSDTSNRVMQFFLPSTDQLLDTKKTYLQFQASASGTDAYLDIVGSSAHKLFNRLRIYTSSGTELEDINGADNLSQVLTDLLPTDAVTGGLNAGGGFFASTAEAQSVSSSGNGVFCVNLNSGVMTNNKWIPLELTGGGLYFELTMSSSSQVVRTSAGTGSYSVTNARLTYDLLRLDPTTHEEMKKHYRDKGIKLYYSSWQHHPRVVQAGNTRETISITDRSRSARSVLVTMRPSANQNSHAANGYTRTRNNLSEYQIKVGSSYVPAQPVRFLTSTSCASAWKRAEQWQSGLARTSAITNAQYVNDKFFIAESLEAVDEIISGSQHADDVQPIELLLNFSSSTAQAVVDVYVQHDVIVELSPAGVRKFD